MKIKELIEKLSKFPQDVEVEAEVVVSPSRDLYIIGGYDKARQTSGPMLRGIIKETINARKKARPRKG